MKTVLITGGSKRLGKAIVEHYAAKGWQVLFTARHSFEEGVALANSLGANVACLRCATDNRQSGALVAKWVQTKTDGLDLLVCNGSSFAGYAIEDTTPDRAHELIASNFTGPFFLMQQCMDSLKAAGGCVVNIGDIQVQGGVEGFSMYVAAKSALMSITKSAAVEMAPFVRVNALMPGTMPWPDSDALYSLAEKEEILSRIPLKRLGEWSDLVHALDFIQSASFVTGVCLPIDGGRSAVL